MKTIFVGSSYHFKNTKSSQFFIEILHQNFSNVFVTNSLENIPICKIDNLIIWQQLPTVEEIDYFKAKQVTLIPMYDDCPHSIDGWLKYKKYKIFCFSKTLFDLLNNNGFDCFYSQFYIQPNIKNTKISDSINAFFWERYEPLNWTLIGKVCNKLPVNHLHFHTGLSFNNNLTLRPTQEDNKKYDITYTSWFQNKEEMNDILFNTQIYFAPRKSEGIGMSFIEALAAGSLIVAYDFPTMNEYINSNIDGILYNENNIPTNTYTKEDLIRMQAASINRTQEGYEKWINSIPEIIRFIEKPISNYVPKKSFNLFMYYSIYRIKKLIKIIIFYDKWKKKQS